MTISNDNFNENFQWQFQWQFPNQNVYALILWNSTFSRSTATDSVYTCSSMLIKDGLTYRCPLRLISDSLHWWSSRFKLLIGLALGDGSRIIKLEESQDVLEEFEKQWEYEGTETGILSSSGGMLLVTKGSEGSRGGDESTLASVLEKSKMKCDLFPILENMGFPGNILLYWFVDQQKGWASGEVGWTIERSEFSKLIMRSILWQKT